MKRHLSELLEMTLASDVSTPRLKRRIMTSTSLFFAAFAGPSNITRVKLDAGEIEVDLAGWKKSRMQEVMILQAIPLTDPLLKIFLCLDALANE